MFFFLSKFLPLFVYPIGLACILLLVAVFIWRWRRWQTAVLISAFLLLFIAANPVFSWYFARSLEWRYLPPETLPEVDVIILLGGGTNTSGYPQPSINLNSAGDRLLYTTWLYQQGVSDHILLTSGKLPGSKDGGAERMAEALEIMGVPREALWLENESLNTYENVIYSQPILEENGVETALLVTSALHMPRSVAIFAKHGIEVIPAPTDYEAVWVELEADERPSAIYMLNNLMPKAYALELTSKTMKEYIGILVYRLRGWL